MKKIRTYIRFTAAVLVLSLAITGCDSFLDVNTSPNSLKTANTTQVLTAAMVSTAFYAGLDFYLYSSIFTQQFAGSGPAAQQSRIYDTYVLTNTDVNNAYSNYYAGALTDLDVVKKQALKEGNPQYAGMARILQAYNYQNIVDAWGDLPYKEALKGVTNVQPKYDNSKEIYDSLILLIDKGIANLGQTNSRTPGAEDVIFGGNIQKWIKFANTLKMRILLHYAKDDAGAKLNAHISGTTAANLMQSNADNFAMSFENVTNRQNPIQQFEITRQDYLAPSTIFVGMLNTKNDPRRAFYFTASPAAYPLAGPLPLGSSDTAGTGTTATITFATQTVAPYPVGATITVAGVTPAGYNGTYVVTACTTTSVSYANVTTGSQTVAGTITYVPTYVGFLSGNAQASPNSRMHTYLRGSVTAETAARTGQGSPTATAITYDGIAPQRMLTYAEYCFIRAEATLSYGASAAPLANAQAWYQAGITASMTDVGVSAGNITTYITANGTLPGPAATDLRLIIEEKYVASFGGSMEQWTDWRRTGFPVLTPSAAAVGVGNNVIPRILVYPLSEQQTNIANVPNRSNMLSKSVFWDK